MESKDIALYFIEKENGESSIREIPIEENGHIQPAEWPKGFFEDSLKEAFALATEQSKNRTMKNLDESKFKHKPNAE